MYGTHDTHTLKSDCFIYDTIPPPEDPEAVRAHVDGNRELRPRRKGHGPAAVGDSLGIR